MLRVGAHAVVAASLLMAASCADDEKRAGECGQCPTEGNASDEDGRGGSDCTACSDASGAGPRLDAAADDDELDGGSAADDGGANASTDASSDAAGDSGTPSWPTGPIRPKRLRLPDPPITMGPCTGGNGKVSAHETLFGQTHLTPKGWPFQTVSANRPLTIAVVASGTGAAPAMSVTAKLNGKDLTVCLTGAAMLAADMNDVAARSYRASLPAAWVQPGLKIDVTVAGTTETLDVDVKAENGLTLYLVAAQLFGAGTPQVLNEPQMLEYLAHLPVSYLDVGANPFGVWRPTRLLVGARDDGLTPQGVTTSYPAMLLRELPHCSAADKSAGTCAPNSGFGTMSAVLGALDTFREANGVADSSTWYAHHASKMGGGLAGGQRGTGDDMRFTMNHELGHAWGFPHWAADHTDYPYEGVQRDRGGFGDRWALNQVSGKVISPLCSTGLERQSPMQRASCGTDNAWPDPHSDYESARLLRMTLGAAAEQTGTVAYAGGTQAAATRAYKLPKESGRPRMVWNSDKPGFTYERYDEASNEYVAHTPLEWNRIEQSEVPVVMFSGAVIVGKESFFEAPVEYVGNVLKKLDPADAQDYAYLYAHRQNDFYWAHDLNLRFTLDDGSVLHRLYGGGKVRADGESQAFAYNLPAELGKRVTKLEVLSRPLGWYDTSARLTASDSAANYYAKARVLATWTRP